MDETTHFTQEDRKTLTQVETKLDRAIDDIKNLSSNFVSKIEFNDFKKQTEKQVSGLEGNNRWIVRTIGTVILIAILGLIITHK